MSKQKALTAPVIQNFVSRLIDRKSYTDWVDRIHELPRGYKFFEFIIFSGEDNHSIKEHIGHSRSNVEESLTNNFLKLISFPNYLAGQHLLDA